jgi:hypothetical protein
MRYHPTTEEEAGIAKEWFPANLGLTSFSMIATIDPCTEDDQSVVLSMTMVIPPDIEEWLERNLQGQWCVLSTGHNRINRIWCESQEDSVLVNLACG